MKNEAKRRGKVCIVCEDAGVYFSILFSPRTRTGEMNYIEFLKEIEDFYLETYRCPICQNTVTRIMIREE